jgi:hypothetical protein
VAGGPSVTRFTHSSCRRGRESGLEGIDDDNKPVSRTWAVCLYLSLNPSLVPPRVRDGSRDRDGKIAGVRGGFGAQRCLCNLDVTIYQLF